MKNKSLVVFLLMAFAFCFVLSVQAQPPNEDDTSVLVFDAPVENPIAQNYQSQTVPIPSNFQLPPTDTIDKYGLVGFIVITALGLVVYTVKSDRQTMTGLIASIQSSAQATEHHAKATEKLADQIENRIEQMHMDVKTRLENLEKLIIRIDPSKA